MEGAEDFDEEGFGGSDSDDGKCCDDLKSNLLP